jgi:hypothetical protein
MIIVDNCDSFIPLHNCLLVIALHCSKHSSDETNLDFPIQTALLRILSAISKFVIVGSIKNRQITRRVWKCFRSTSWRGLSIIIVTPIMSGPRLSFNAEAAKSAVEQAEWNVKKWVWVPDVREGYVAGYVHCEDEDSAEVVLDSGRQVISIPLNLLLVLP